LTKTPKLTRAKRIPEWTTYDKEVAEMAQRLLKKDAFQRNGGKGTAVDESMFVQIDSPGQKEPLREEGKQDEAEARVKDEL
jgi:UDP-glucose:glycoprotein glucosyltransferase